MIIEGSVYMAWQAFVGPAVIEMGKALGTGVVEHYVTKKDEKSFFIENKKWIFTIILSIFVTKLDYINMFKNVILNSVINIIYGIIVLVLLVLYFSEVKDVFKIDSKFIEALMVFLIVLGVINFFYHVCYAISELLPLVL